MARIRLGAANITATSVLALAALLATSVVGCVGADAGRSTDSSTAETRAPSTVAVALPTRSADPDPSTTPAPDEAGVIFHETFESLAAWDVASYTFSGWGLDPSAGGANAPSAALGPYVNHHEAKMGHVLQLPASTPLTLQYSAWYETEAKFDELIVWVHGVGDDDWESLASHSGSSGGGFLEYAVDLTPYAGRDIEIVFGFRSDGRDAVSGGGARVDDVAVLVGGRE